MIGILVDVTRCNGCNQCVKACIEENSLGKEERLPQQNSDDLSAQRWAAIMQSPEGHPVRKSCRHCLEPACVSVCPVGAMYKTPEGPVLYDSHKCMGCRYCMMACPYGIPRYQWDSVTPLVRKCTLCADRIKAGQIPACVEACPEKSLIFGDRNDLLRIAHDRIMELPGKYLPKVYGETQAGGTSILYITDISLDFFTPHGNLGEAPLPEMSWKWLSKVPIISVMTTGLMTGLFWVIGRRMQAEEARAHRLKRGLE